MILVTLIKSEDYPNCPVYTTRGKIYFSDKDDFDISGLTGRKDAIIDFITFTVRKRNKDIKLIFECID